MASIYNKKENTKILDGGSTVSPSNIESSSVVPPEIKHQEVTKVEFVSDENSNVSFKPKSVNDYDIAMYQSDARSALALVDDIVMKNYLTKLSEFDIIPLENINHEGVILYKINKMVYEKDEYTTDKFISVVSAMTYASVSIFLVIDGHETHTDFYLGIKCCDDDRTPAYIAETFKNSLIGQFPGTQISDFSLKEKDKERSEQDHLFHYMSNATTISQCVGIPSYKNNKGEYSNSTFIQGIEKFATAMQGKRYTTVVLASNVVQSDINEIRSGYENIYTQLSALSSQQLAYTTNESLSNAITRTKGYSDGTSLSNTVGSSTTTTKGENHSVGTSNTKGTNKSTTHSEGESHPNDLGMASKLIGGMAMSVNPFVGLSIMGAGYLAGGTNQLNSSDSTSYGESETFGESENYGTSHSIANSVNKSQTQGSSHTETFSEANGTTSSIGSSKNFTLTVQNKHIQEIQKRIDSQLERVSICESLGLWATSAYFLSYDNDRSIAETGAAIFRAIMQGEQSGVELSAINTWRNNNNNFSSLKNYVCSFQHPEVIYSNNFNFPLIPTSMLNSKEVAILMGLPRKSVPGFNVVEHISLGKEVVRTGVSNESGSSICLGTIYDQGVKRENKVSLDVKSLTLHTFITGSTGCGKSETVYKIIDSLRNSTDTKFLIIEPAKGEYKNVFGNAQVYGSNPSITELVRINPFKFTKGVHVLEHADRLIEIFNVCWPMYAAMPAVLKEAVLNVYENCGWNLVDSTNKCSDELFPSFAELMDELEDVINNSSYSDEVKNNYKGSLITRIKSLTNGINGEIFSENELGDKKLFDENVIIDLSRLGSIETKSLIMGVLIMRLNEYRSNSGIKENSGLRHITVLEEAHNILKNTIASAQPSESSGNIVGKSVEMIANSIAEMRTYGEGFVIVDQSPAAVDMSAIRNTNTKIIMRLPEETDRKVSGKSAAMKDNQIDEIAKLPTGVAVVYQNDWEEPVLCKIEQFDSQGRVCYKSEPRTFVTNNCSNVVVEIIKFLISGISSNYIQFDLEMIENELLKVSVPSSIKIELFEALREFKEKKSLNIWQNCQFTKLSRIITSILNVRKEVEKVVFSTNQLCELEDNITTVIYKKWGRLPNDISLELCQCVMRDFSHGNDFKLSIYNAWISATKK